MKTLYITQEDFDRFGVTEETLNSQFHLKLEIVQTGIMPEGGYYICDDKKLGYSLHSNKATSNKATRVEQMFKK